MERREGERERRKEGGMDGSFMDGWMDGGREGGCIIRISSLLVDSANLEKSINVSNGRNVLRNEWS